MTIDATNPADAPQRVCFVVPGRLPTGGRPAIAPLSPPPLVGEALATLLALLGCGEEAAANAFDGLAALADDPVASAALARIAAEERVHDALLRDLRAALPVPQRRTMLMARSRRLHLDLAAGGPALHFARIAALDAAVCLVLTRLLTRGGVVAGLPAARDILVRIRTDEARHVTMARAMTRRFADRGAMRAAAAQARSDMADVLRLARAEFEILGVDSERLIGDVARLPAGLIAA